MFAEDWKSILYIVKELLNQGLCCIQFRFWNGKVDICVHSGLLKQVPTGTGTMHQFWPRTRAPKHFPIFQITKQFFPYQKIVVPLGKRIWTRHACPCRFLARIVKISLPSWRSSDNVVTRNEVEYSDQLSPLVAVNEIIRMTYEIIR